MASQSKRNLTANLERLQLRIADLLEENGALEERIRYLEETWTPMRAGERLEREAPSTAPAWVEELRRLLLTYPPADDAEVLVVRRHGSSAVTVTPATVDQLEALDLGYLGQLEEALEKDRHPLEAEAGVDDEGTLENEAGTQLDDGEEGDP